MPGDDTTKQVVIFRTELQLHRDTGVSRSVFKDSYDSNLWITLFIWYGSEDHGLFHSMTQLEKIDVALNELADWLQIEHDALD